MKKILQKLLIGLLSVTAGAALFAACGQTPCEVHTPSKNRVVTEETHSVVCADCGETISTQAHTFGTWHERTAVTCTEDGLEYAVCSGCAYEKTRTIEAQGHTEPVLQRTEEGHTQVCDECNEPLSEFSAHNFGEWQEIKKAECGIAGEKMRVCADCNYEEVEEIGALNHSNEVFFAYDDNGHWEMCSACEQAIDGTYATHTLVNNACDCGYHVPTAAELLDFVVDVPTGRDPIVLQLTDTQFIDAGQRRPGQTGIHEIDWATEMLDANGFNYIEETVETVNPDLIIITGDIVYGRFDDNGSVWTRFVNFMDAFDIPWAPIFGNHDNESAMGVDWQCAQLAKAKNCLFKQRELTGNGNYSIGLTQGGKLLRAFYMLDSNGCGDASEASLANGHTRNDFVGFAQDQINWYTETITLLHQYYPETPISFAYHIQSKIVTKAYAKYGCDSSTKGLVNIDKHQDKAEGDFGILQTALRGEWDDAETVWRGMKALGVDSVFLGHEHDVSASVVYDGVRIQFGQKSTAYDTLNWVKDADGTLFSSPDVAGSDKYATPLIGGTVMTVSQSNGTFSNAYIFLCKNAGGNLS